MPKYEAGSPRIRERRAVPGEFVVKLAAAARQRPGVLSDIIGPIANRFHPVTISSPVDRFGMAVLHVDPNADSAGLLDDLRRHPDVEFVEPNFIDSGS